MPILPLIAAPQPRAWRSVARGNLSSFTTPRHATCSRTATSPAMGFSALAIRCFATAPCWPSRCPGSRARRCTERCPAGCGKHWRGRGRAVRQAGGDGLNVKKPLAGLFWTVIYRHLWQRILQNLAGAQRNAHKAQAGQQHGVASRFRHGHWQWIGAEITGARRRKTVQETVCINRQRRAQTGECQSDVFGCRAPAK